MKRSAVAVPTLLVVALSAATPASAAPRPPDVVQWRSSHFSCASDGEEGTCTSVTVHVVKQAEHETNNAEDSDEISLAIGRFTEDDGGKLNLLFERFGFVQRADIPIVIDKASNVSLAPTTVPVHLFGDVVVSASHRAVSPATSTQYKSRGIDGACLTKFRTRVRSADTVGTVRLDDVTFGSVGPTYEATGSASTRDSRTKARCKKS